MKTLQTAKNDINRLALAFPKELIFKFSPHEMTWFEKLYAVLAPKAKAKKHMEEAMAYLESHICDSTHSLQPLANSE
jgi:hypothetical protein